MKATEYKTVFETFGLEIEYVSLESIYPFAPVFRYQKGTDDFIIKRTKTPPFSRAENLLNWTKSISDDSIKVVTPIDSISPNPVEIDDKVWIVYPFVRGILYSGIPEHLIGAADLLGRIHAHQPEIDFGLPRFTWDNFDDDYNKELEGDLSNLNALGKKLNLDSTPALVKKIELFLTDKLPQLKKHDLPLVNATWDYKANNLVYSEDNRPTLIDPDNAGRIPRLFDLALALILFNNEFITAPPRMLTVFEWELFRNQYLSLIELTEVEKEIWQDFLFFVFIDEAIWLILDTEFDESGWGNPHQKKFLLSLMNFSFEDYKIL
ncbi:MAG: aminoglycoside phosphotransferase family protein [candidate division Zixibacteria bacterium]|nr:aminoglycoside phosphotransferase family protein [candidate division Zixibacteria bacterium]